MVGELTKCIRTNADCADICNATASVLLRHTGYDANITRAILQACATVCKACGAAAQTRGCPTLLRAFGHPFSSAGPSTLIPGAEADFRP